MQMNCLIIRFIFYNKITKKWLASLVSPIFFKINFYGKIICVDLHSISETGTIAQKKWVVL